MRCQALSVNFPGRVFSASADTGVGRSPVCPSGDQMRKLLYEAKKSPAGATWGAKRRYSPRNPMRFLPQTCRRLFPALLFVFAFVWGIQPLHASGTSASTGTVLVLPVGNASDIILLQNNAAAPLRDAGVGLATLDDASLVGFEAEAAVKCLDEDGECEHLLRKAPAEWVLLLRIRHGDGTSPPQSKETAEDREPTGEGPEVPASSVHPDEDQTVIAKLYSANDGSLLQVEQRLCKRCGSRERMAKLTMELIAEVTLAELANQATETYINVSSTPANAILSIDGTVVGPTGQAYRVKPGEHQVAVTLEGYRSASQTVDVAANEHKAITVGLGQEGASTASGTGRRVLTWAALGTGVVALGAGVAWVVVDGNTMGTGGARDDVRDTMTLGVSSMIAGSVLLGAGIALLLTDDDGSKEMQISAAPTPEGVALGISGRF